MPEDPIAELLSEVDDQATEGKEEETSLGTSDPEQKIEIDGEELTIPQLKEIAEAKKNLEKENARLAKQHKEIQKLASRKGVSQDDIRKITSEEPEQPKEEDEEDFSGFDVDRDRKYLTRKIGVVTRDELEQIEKRITERTRIEAEQATVLAQQMVELQAGVDTALKQYNLPLEAKKELIDYMHFKAVQQRQFITPAQAVEKLYPSEYKKKPTPAPLPVTDSSSKGNVDAPVRKPVGFDDPQGMHKALEEIMFPGEVE